MTQYAAIERTTVALAGGALASGSALAQPDSPTAVPTEASGATGGSGLALLAFLVVALVGAGLVLAAVSALVSVALVEVFGPFGDRTHLLLPTVIGVGPTAVLVVSFGPELLAVLVLTELVALPATGLLLRRRYRRAE